MIEQAKKCFNNSTSKNPCQIQSVTQKKEKINSENYPNKAFIQD